MAYLRSVLLCLLILTWVAPSTADEQELDLKGFIFGETRIDEWKKAVRETGEVYGKRAIVSPFCEEQGADLYLSSKEFHAPEIGIVSCYRYNPQCVLCINSLGQAATKRNLWTFVDGRLAFFNAYMHRAQLGNLLPPLKAKFGEPTSISREKVHNALGAEFENIIWAWHLKGMSIILKKYAGSLKYSNIDIFHPGLFSEAERRLKNRQADTSNL